MNIKNPKHIKTFIFLAFTVLISVVPVHALNFVDDTQSEFDAGTYGNTTYNSTEGYIQLLGTNTTGNYTSRVFDAGSMASWNNITWSEDKHYYGLFITDVVKDTYKSLDFGDGFKEVDTQHSTNNAKGIVFYENVFYMVDGGCRILNSTDYGATWNEITSSFTGDSCTSSLEFDIDIYGNFYVIEGDDDVWRSNDTGVTFTKVNDDYNDALSGTIAGLDHNSTNALYLVDSLADVWMSVDNGTTWTKVNDDYNGDTTNNAADLYVDDYDIIWILHPNEDVWNSTYGTTFTLANDDFNGADGNAGLFIVGGEDYIFIVDGSQDIYRSTNNATSFTLAIANLNGVDGDITAMDVLVSDDVSSIKFQARSDDDNASWGAFTGSDGTTATCYINSTLENLNVSDHRYFQYIAYFTTNDTDYTPKLYNVTIDYTPDYLPDITALNYPENNSWATVSIDFNFTVEDDFGFTNCTLYGNFSGNWAANETITTVNNGTVNNITISPAEGTYIWNVLCYDNASTPQSDWYDNNYTVTVDTTKPNQVKLNAPDNTTNTTNNWILFNFTAIDNLASTLNCSLYINNTLNTTNSSSVNNTPTTFNVTEITETTYEWNITCLDNALNSNSSSTRSFTIDASAPVINTITISPSSTDDVDPNVQINVTANVTDAGVGVDTVIFQYKQDSAITWTNDTMDYNSTTSLYENASFTPDLPGTWNYKIWSNDTLGNSGTNTQTNLTVEYDYTWIRSPAEFGVVSGIITTTSDVGILTINNTGDYTLNFDLSSDWADTFYNVTEPFDLVAKAVKVINITATYSATTREDDITITIDATSVNADPSSYTTNATLASYAGGPYFDVSIVTYSAAVSQSQSGISLNAKIKNIGNETSTNTWLNWTLPAGWTNTSGNLTQDIGNLTSGSTTWNNLTILINARQLPPQQ